MIWYGNDMIWYGNDMAWYDTIWYMIYMMIYDMIYDIFVNCNWVYTRWQQYVTLLHINEYTEQHNETEYTE